jgi:hypothetical protein
MSNPWADNLQQAVPDSGLHGVDTGAGAEAQKLCEACCPVVASNQASACGCIVIACCATGAALRVFAGHLPEGPVWQDKKGIWHCPEDAAGD